MTLKTTNVIFRNQNFGQKSKELAKNALNGYYGKLF